jgi:hypothetical protein
MRAAVCPRADPPSCRAFVHACGQLCPRLLAHLPQLHVSPLQVHARREPTRGVIWNVEAAGHRKVCQLLRLCAQRLARPLAVSGRLGRLGVHDHGSVLRLLAHRAMGRWWSARAGPPGPLLCSDPAAAASSLRPLAWTAPLQPVHAATRAASTRARVLACCGCDAGTGKRTEFHDEASARTPTTPQRTPAPKAACRKMPRCSHPHPSPVNTHSRAGAEADPPHTLAVRRAHARPAGQGRGGYTRAPDGPGNRLAPSWPAILLAPSPKGREGRTRSLSENTFHRAESRDGKCSARGPGWRQPPSP